ncbi:MAG: hypothetical protein AB1586_04410 [Pseudomonadota bacterium]|jgi:hypothetical protein
MVALSLPVGTALPLQFVPVNQSLEVAPVQVWSAAAGVAIARPANADPPSQTACHRLKPARGFARLPPTPIVPPRNRRISLNGFCKIPAGLSSHSAQSGNFSAPESPENHDGFQVLRCDRLEGRDSLKGGPRHVFNQKLLESIAFAIIDVGDNQGNCVEKAID